MECSIQFGFASLNGTFHLLPHENICTISLINIHYLYTMVPLMQLSVNNQYFSMVSVGIDKENVNIHTKHRHLHYENKSASFPIHYANIH